MAEIPVEKKRQSLTWLWIVLALVVIALLLWWVTDNDRDDDAAVETDTVAAGSLADDGSAATAAGYTIGDVLDNPATYVGRDDFATEADTPEVPTDRGFWIESEGRRMFALIVDEPREVPLDINPGQRLRITHGMVRDATALDDIRGEALDADTRKIASDQPAFVVVDEDDIQVVSRP